jgi:hypothetical protein
MIFGGPVSPGDIPSHHASASKRLYGEQTGPACPPRGFEVRPEPGELLRREPLRRIGIRTRIEAEDRREFVFVSSEVLAGVVRDRFENDDPLEGLVGRSLRRDRSGVHSIASLRTTDH